MKELLESSNKGLDRGHEDVCSWIFSKEMIRAKNLLLTFNAPVRQVTSTL